jgi:hypothetical protein
VNVDEQTIIPYILATLNNTELAFKLASRANLPGADDLYVKQYQQLFQTGQFSEAAKVAANSPRVCTNMITHLTNFLTFNSGDSTHRGRYRIFQASANPARRVIPNPTIFRHPIRKGRT